MRAKKVTLAILTLLLALIFGNTSLAQQPSIDHKDSVRCLAQNIYFEARSESYEGQLAVAHVTLNRVKSNIFPQTICGVVQQRSNQVCQFSWWCDKKLRGFAINNVMNNHQVYKDIKQLATDIVTNQHRYVDNTNGALFYHAKYVSRNSLGSLKIVPTVTIGQHIFYRMDI